MNKAAIKKMLAPQITTIKAAETSMAISRWKRAKAFSEMQSMVIWSKSPYTSFTKFVEQEFPDMSSSSIRCWVVNYNQMLKWYTWVQIQALAKSVSYSKAVQLQQSIASQPKLPFAKFVKEAKNYKYVRAEQKKLVPNENRIILTMPVLYVEKLENILVGHGYKIPKAKTDPKAGISDAMVKYLDTV